MTRNTALKILNPLLACLALSQILSGLLRGFLPWDTFKLVHLTGGVSLAAAAALHVVLNWNWIKANYLKSKPAVTIPR
jgi:hypothetical protein